MEDLGKHIKEILDEQGRSQRWLSKQLGITEATVSAWIKKVSKPRTSMVTKIADALNVPVERLIWGNNAPSFGKETIINLNNIITIPIYGEASCGNGTYNDGTDIEYIELPDREFSGNPENYFAVRANGDSMVDAHIPNGAICIFKKENVLPTSGKIITCAYKEHNAYIKRYKDIGGQILLRSENYARQSEYEDIIVTSDDFFRVEGWLYKVILNGSDL